MKHYIKAIGIAKKDINKKFKVQPTLSNIKGGLKYDTHYEKQVYYSHPNYKKRNFVQFYFMFLLRLRS